ncbi:MAG: orotate phosphoribosyltransferase [Nitrospira sp. WS238]|nr:orotate phosphoribosyltransferase [Nitrospira sp. WS238]
MPRGGRIVTVQEQLAKLFHDTQSFKWDRDKGFRLASGKLSPFYVDCRALMAHPEARRLVADLAYDALADIEFDCLGGLELGAIPIAITISDFACAASPQRLWRTFVVRKQPKDHGLGKLIEGSIHRTDRALIVDDVLTSGGSLLKAVGVAREAGLRVDHALVIVDRLEQDGRARVEREQIRLISLLTIQDLMRTAPHS